MMDAIKIVGEVKIGKLQLAPGDVLVVKCNGRVRDYEAVSRLRDQVASKLPAGVKCMVIDDLVDLSVLTRVEIESKAA